MLNQNKSLSLDLTKTKKNVLKINIKFVLAITATVIITVIICSLIFLNRNQWGILKSVDAQNYDNLKQSFREIIDIKDGNEPTVIEIANAEPLKLQNSVLYTQIQNNDLMLVFKDKVIIYRPSENKIVNIFPVNN